MRFGVCAPPSELLTLAHAGYDYLEPPIAALLQPERSDAEIMPPLRELFAASPLKPETFNLFLPGDLKVVGPESDTGRQVRYLTEALSRASQIGGKLTVFGSGGARSIPDGWAVAEARSQLSAFLTRCGTIAEQHGMTIAIEPLNTAECNFINSVAEAVTLAPEVNHANVGVLSDLYHITQDHQSYRENRDAAPWLRHVHVAGPGRHAPAAADYEYLQEYFAALKEADYAGRISIEATWENITAQAADARQVLQRAWDAA